MRLQPRDVHQRRMPVNLLAAAEYKSDASMCCMLPHTAPDQPDFYPESMHNAAV